jgi:hypothetical protein
MVRQPYPRFVVAALQFYFPIPAAVSFYPAHVTIASSPSAYLCPIESVQQFDNEMRTL